MSDNLTLDLANAPERIARSVLPAVGDVYQKRGGPPGFWVIVSINASGWAYVLSFDMSGEVNGAQHYRASYFAENCSRRVGRTQIHPIHVEWETQ